MPRRLILPLVFPGAILVLALAWIAGAASADVAVQETALNPEGAAYEINAGPQGLLWISDNGADEIWALNAATGVYTIYQNASAPSDARRAADGDVWWIAQTEDRLCRLSPDSGEVTVWDLPVQTTLFGTAVDGGGHVWVTEIFRPQVYRFAVESSQLCTYTFGTIGASDYILAEGTDIWLGDWINDSIHRLDSDSGLLTSWALPGNARPEGLALDRDGHFWWADPDLGHLARLEPDLDRLTTYALPLGSTPEMVAPDGSRLWYTEDSLGTFGWLDPSLATGTSQAISRTTTPLTPSCALISPATTETLPISTGTATWANATYTVTVDGGGWLVRELPLDAYPWGIAASNGEVWMVDTGRQVLARLASRSSVTSCKVADGDGDPNTTADQTPLAGWTVYLSVDGVRQEPGESTETDGCYTWADLAPAHTYGVEEDDLPGWTPLAPISHDFGLIALGESHLHTFVNAEELEVTACKSVDADGDPNTTGDQTSREGWTVYLSVDGVRQEPGQLTGSDGCTTWSDLAPAQAYGVEEDLPSGWTALTPTIHDFGQVTSGRAYTHTFLNAESAEVTACKSVDADGDPATTGDQAPREGWTVYLSVDDVRQVPGQLTGVGGCTTWSDLAPAQAYGVEEDLPSGWTPLAPTSHDFGTVIAGQAYTHTFVNAESAEVTACKSVDVDGDPNTTGDQALREGWTVYLSVDGVRQALGQLTGEDGCATWSDLAPAHTYGVEEDLPSGWTALTPTSHDFGEIHSGQARAFTFVNHQEDTAIYLPVVLR